MEVSELNVVTGAFGYTGKYITRRLLSMGKRVITLTGHPNRQNPFGSQVKVFPFNFDNISKLTETLRGATVLYNTYWVRFPHKHVTFDNAVENMKVLIKASEEAGIRKFVHISITNASENSYLPYFRWKGVLEKVIIHSKLSYTIIRPTVIFGREDILINNIAWFLRKFPVFIIFGQGNYRIQPVYVEDMAEIAMSASQEDDNMIIDAVGPEIYTFDELIRLISEKIHKHPKIIYLPPMIALSLIKLMGYMVKDVILTRDEVEGLMLDLLVSERPPMGQTRLSKWIEQNVDTVGIKYVSELNRHYR